MGLNDYYYDYHDTSVSLWRRVSRVIFNHGWIKEIEPRGMSPEEMAYAIMQKHEKDLDENELKFLKEVKEGRWN